MRTAWASGATAALISREMRLHRRGVAERHDEAGALALGRADRAEDVGPGGALVVRRPRPGAAPGPAAGDLVLLPDPGLVLEPELYALAGMRGADLRHRGPGDFFESLRRLRVLGVVARPRRELADSPAPAAPGPPSPRSPTAGTPPRATAPDRSAASAPPRRAGLRARLDHRASAARCSAFRVGALPGALRSISPSGPSALKRSTQSRTICSPTPPTRAASVRVPPS